MAKSNLNSNVNKTNNMKKTLTAILFFTASAAFCQTTVNERDSVTNTVAFQKKVKLKALSAANDLLADTAQAEHTKRYAQLIITEPSGNGWLTALSYGVMNNPAINWNSPDNDVQFVINSIFIKYAKAYYRIVN